MTCLVLSFFIGCGAKEAKDGSDDKPASPLLAIKNTPADENQKEPEPDLNGPVEMRQRGNEFFALGDYDQAIEFYCASIDAKEDAKTYFNRGTAYMSKNELDKALADYDKAVQLEPTAASPFINRGLLLQRMGKTAQGVNDM